MTFEFNGEQTPRTNFQLKTGDINLLIILSLYEKKNRKEKITLIIKQIKTENNEFLKDIYRRSFHRLANNIYHHNPTAIWVYMSHCSQENFQNHYRAFSPIPALNSAFPSILLCLCAPFKISYDGDWMDSNPSQEQ